jgi:hypothetical protein
MSEPQNTFEVTAEMEVTFLCGLISAREEIRHTSTEAFNALTLVIQNVILSEKPSFFVYWNKYVKQRAIISDFMRDVEKWKQDADANSRDFRLSVYEDLHHANKLENTSPEITLLDGSPVANGSYLNTDATGMQKSYVVLSDEERAKGFVRPLRKSYIHTCGAITTMADKIAETYARDPTFYSGTFCINCKAHLPLSEFVWTDTLETLGS